MGRTYMRTAMERGRLIAEQYSSGKTQKSWCKEHGISTKTFRRWVVDAKRSEVQSGCGADWMEFPGCDSASGLISVPDTVIEISVGAYTVRVKPCFDRETMLAVCRILGEIC